MEVYSAAPPGALSDRLAASAGSAEAELAATLPRQPRTVRDTGLEARLVTALAVKIMHASGKTPLSLLTGRPVRRDVGMTGEVTLSGRVLPIGGVKQKVLAAHRAGLTEVILPARNGPDLDDLPDEVRDAMTVHLVSDVAEVLDLALAA